MYPLCNVHSISVSMVTFGMCMYVQCKCMGDSEVGERIMDYCVCVCVCF